MKEGNRLNEPVIKGAALNESGPVCPISDANKSILPRFVIKKRWESDYALEILRGQIA